MSALDGRYIMGVLGCDLAADPIGRQACVADVRAKAKAGLSCERPALVLVAVEPGLEDEAAQRIRATLDPAVDPAPDECGEFDPDELARWAESYGHPEEWAKRAQAANGRAERAEELLREWLAYPERGARVRERTQALLHGLAERAGEER